eukprot:5188655-Pyramimonas_sp.AAC.1
MCIRDSSSAALPTPKHPGVAPVVAPRACPSWPRGRRLWPPHCPTSVSYTHLRAHETGAYL